jgi:hypothetical protein
VLGVVWQLSCVACTRSCMCCAQAVYASVEHTQFPRPLHLHPNPLRACACLQPYSPDLLREFVAFARARVQPSLTPAAEARLIESYKDLRRQCSNEKVRHTAAHSLLRCPAQQFSVAGQHSVQGNQLQQCLSQHSVYCCSPAILHDTNQLVLPCPVSHMCSQHAAIDRLASGNSLCKDTVQRSAATYSVQPLSVHWCNPGCLPWLDSTVPAMQLLICCCRVVASLPPHASWRP